MSVCVLDRVLAPTVRMVRVGLFRTSSSRRLLEEKAHEGGALKNK